MKKFIAKTIFISAPLIITYILISLITSNRKEVKNDYLATMIDKHMLVDSIKGPKIIFAGGSSVAFGISSVEIQEELKIPVVNLGLHVGLGLLFILEELKNSVRSGDVVFLCIEYYPSLEGDYRLKKLASSFYKEANKYYNHSLVNEANAHIQKTKNDIKTFLTKTITGKASEDQDNSVYSRKAFNSHGDVIAHLEQENLKGLHNKERFEYGYWEGIKELNAFNKYAKENNIKVFFLYPPYAKSEYQKNKETITKYANDLKRDLKIPILIEPYDFVYDDSLFYDTVVHLNKRGRQQHTEKLIKIIKSAITLNISDRIEPQKAN